jgi:2-methylcitrate dehydratase PrpD
MEETIQKNLAAFVSECDFAKIPEHFKEDARYRVLDWLGCAVAGAHYPQVEISAKYFDSLGDAGSSSVILHNKKYSVRTAAFLNGIAGHVCELDDGHRTAIGHPGSVAVPTALSLAEKLNSTGEEFLKAVILGYDMFARTGRTVNPTHYKTWHTTGTCGTLAAAAAAASLLKLTPEETNNALGIAATMAGGLVESFGSHAKAINIAEACQNGIDAAYLAKNGLTGSHSALLGKKGFVAATCTEPHIENLENPTETSLVSDTAFYKVYSSCGHTNSPLDLTFKFIKEVQPNPDDIEKIDIQTYKVSVDLTSALKVATEDEAKFSLPFCVAIAILYKSVALAYFTDKVRKDEKVLSLARKVTVSENPEATARFPKRQAELQVTMKDGTVYRYQTLNSCDDADNAQIVAKFEAATQNLTTEQREKLICFITTVDQQPGIGEIFGILQNK